MIRRGTPAARALVAGGFAQILVRPVRTMGNRAFGMPLPRRRLHAGWPILVAHVAGVPGAIALRALISGARLLLQAALLMLAALVLSGLEEERLIHHGDLILPRDEAMAVLLRSWSGSFALSIVALFCPWRSDARG